MPHKDHWRDGKRLVSVTELITVLNKPFLDKWKQGLCVFQQGQCGFVKAKQIAEEAADLGNKVHEDVATWFNEGLPTTDWGLKIANKLTELQVSKYLIEPETDLKDEESNLAGSPDAIVKVNGKPAILDFKIKNSLDDNTDDQGSGYSYLIKRLHNVEITDMLVIWCQKKSVGMNVKAVWLDLKSNADNWKALVKRWNKANPTRQVVIHE